MMKVKVMKMKVRVIMVVSSILRQLFSLRTMILAMDDNYVFGPALSAMFGMGWDVYDEEWKADPPLLWALYCPPKVVELLDRPNPGRHLRTIKIIWASVLENKNMFWDKITYRYTIQSKGEKPQQRNFWWPSPFAWYCNPNRFVIIMKKNHLYEWRFPVIVITSLPLLPVDTADKIVLEVVKLFLLQVSILLLHLQGLRQPCQHVSQNHSLLASNKNMGDVI